MSAAPKIFLTASAVAALAVVSFAAPARAQSRLLSHPISIVRDGPVVPTVEDARQLVKDGKWKEASTAFTSIVDNARTRGDYSREALTELANLKYMMNDVRGAARVYEELGAQAEIFADPPTELDARYKAALLFQETHDKRAVALQMPRIKQLLKSPAIAQQVRDAIARKLPA